MNYGKSQLKKKCKEQTKKLNAMKNTQKMKKLPKLSHIQALEKLKNKILKYVLEISIEPNFNIRNDCDQVQPFKETKNI